jgi:prepilin-type N-terminal cleavage/methylation domain-containing protein
MRWDEDDGVTLIEMLISLMIMAVMMTMFTTGVLQMYRAANKTESLSSAQSELNTVFLRLDKIVRYAVWISDTRQVGQRYDIRMRTTNDTGQHCYAFMVTGGDNSRLLVTDWDPDVSAEIPRAAAYDSVPTAGSPEQTIWVVLANDVDAPAGGAPFERIPADAVQNFDRLQLTLVASVGSANSSTKTDTSISFTALNTSLVRAADLCQLRQG